MINQMSFTSHIKKFAPKEGDTRNWVLYANHLVDSQMPIESPISRLNAIATTSTRAILAIHRALQRYESIIEQADEIGLGGVSIWANVEAMFDKDYVKRISDSNQSID